MIFYFTFHLLCKIEGQFLSHLISEEGTPFHPQSDMLLKTLIMILQHPFKLVLSHYLTDCTKSFHGFCSWKVWGGGVTPNTSNKDK